MLTMVRIPPRPTSGRVCDIARYSATQPRRGRSDVTLVTDAYGGVRLGRDENNCVERRDVHRCRRSIDVAAPHSERLSAPPRAGFQLVSHGMLFVYERPLCANSGHPRIRLNGDVCFSSVTSDRRRTAESASPSADDFGRRVIHQTAPPT